MSGQNTQQVCWVNTNSLAPVLYVFPNGYIFRSLEKHYPKKLNNLFILLHMNHLLSLTSKPIPDFTDGTTLYSCYSTSKPIWLAHYLSKHVATISNLNEENLIDFKAEKNHSFILTTRKARYWPTLLCLMKPQTELPHSHWTKKRHLSKSWLFLLHIKRPVTIFRCQIWPVGSIKILAEILRSSKGIFRLPENLHLQSTATNCLSFELSIQRYSLQKNNLI